MMISKHPDVSITQIDPDLGAMSSMWEVISGILPVKWCLGLVYRMYLVFLWAPLAYLYFHGPSFGGYAFWAGKSLDDICHSLTNVDSNFWRSSQENMIQCHSIAMKSFHSFMTGIMMLLYFIFLFGVAALIIRCLRPASVAPIIINSAEKLSSMSVVLHRKITRKREKGTPSPRKKQQINESPLRSPKK